MPSVPDETSHAEADATSFVLVEPSHAGNVGAAARAIRVMGFGRLVLVRPRHAGL
ncbi:MAG: RNA methyltransferase, partial [Burkholderiaceae bacterium]|nr:RNA methyltransferase [Burkholderiaceae bacterium]